MEVKLKNCGYGYYQCQCWLCKYKRKELGLQELKLLLAEDARSSFNDDEREFGSQEAYAADIEILAELTYDMREPMEPYKFDEKLQSIVDAYGIDTDRNPDGTLNLKGLISRDIRAKKDSNV